MKTSYVGVLLLSVLCCARVANAQQPETEPAVTESAPDTAVAELNNANQGPVIRLEDTIRGNKEQPQVLTIVPWQLPTHKRIDEATKWQPVVSQLPPIERTSMLRNLQIFQQKNE